MRYFTKITTFFLFIIILVIETSYAQSFKIIDGQGGKSRKEIINGNEVTFHSLEDCSQDEYRKNNKEACEQTEAMHKILSKTVIGKTIRVPKKQYPSPEFSVLLMEAYRSKDPIIQAEVGFRYIVGFGAKKNLSQAIEWYKKAALQNYQPAKMVLGNLLATGYISKLGLLGTNSKPLHSLIYLEARGLEHFSFDNCLENKTNSEIDVAELKKIITNFNIKLNEAIHSINEGDERKASDFLSDFLFVSYNTLGIQCSYSRTVNNLYNAVKHNEKGRGNLSPTDFRIKPHTSKDILESIYSKPKYMLMVSDTYLEQKNHRKASAWLKELAQINSEYADYYLGISQFIGKGTPNEYEWFKKHAEKGNPHAQYRLGVLYYDGEAVSKDFKHAFQWFSKSAKQGYADAQYHLSIMYDDGIGVNKDDMKAYKWYIKAAEQGHLRANNHFGHSSGVQTNRSKFKWSLMGAINGNSDAQNTVGLMYEKGIGTDKDYNEAFKWYMKASKQGNVSSNVNIGMMYEEGRGVFKDLKKAHDFFLEAAKKGDALAQYKVAVMYDEGKSVQQDHVHAYEWFLKAAKQNNKDAIYRVGVMHAEGIGANIDYLKSYEFLFQIADKGNAKAQYQIARLLANGKLNNNNVSKDPVRDSILWYLKSAILKNIDAQVALSNINKEIGNPIKAQAWANIVQINEPNIALDLKNGLLDLLTNEQIHEANQFTEEYKRYMREMIGHNRRPGPALKELFYNTSSRKKLGSELNDLYNIVVDADLLKKHYN